MDTSSTFARHIDFEGIENFRDFGGYPGAGGARLRSGRLYRSANHSRATETDIERLRALSPAAIVDLRRRDERADEPSRRWPGFAGAVIENDTPAAHPDWLATVRDPAVMTAAWFHEDSLGFYRALPFEVRHVDLFRRYFQALASVEGPIVVHCAAGKDRTGFVCALTHHVLGVHRDDMIADFLLTNDEARIARKMAAIGDWVEQALGARPSDAALRVGAAVHAEHLETAFALIAEAHGSLDGYLREVLGVDDALRARLQAQLLE